MIMICATCLGRITDPDHLEQLESRDTFSITGVCIFFNKVVNMETYIKVNKLI